MTTLETSKPQFTFTQFGATRQAAVQRCSDGDAQRVGDWVGQPGQAVWQWQNRGVVVARSSSIFLRRRLWALGRAHTRIPALPLRVHD